MATSSQTGIAKTFAAWIRAIEAANPLIGAAQFHAPLPSAIARATRDEFMNAGFTFSPDAPRSGSWFPHQYFLNIEFSPDATHCAITLKYEAWAGAVLWVDGVSIDVPCDQQGGPMIDYLGAWIDDNTFAVAVGGLEHPLADPRKNIALGDITGLLLWDAARTTKLTVLPNPQQAWKSPVAVRENNKIVIFSDAAARDQLRPPERIIDWSQLTS